MFETLNDLRETLKVMRSLVGEDVTPKDELTKMISVFLHSVGVWFGSIRDSFPKGD